MLKSTARRMLEEIAERAERSRKRTGPTPSIKIKQRGKAEVELQVKIPVDWSDLATTEQYTVQLYYFQPENLASVDSNFYSEIVRLLSFKAPERTLADLAGAELTEQPIGGSPRAKGALQLPEEKDRIFRKITEEVEVLVRDYVKSPLPNLEEQKKLTTTLTNRIRTIGCLYREALRTDTKVSIEILSGLIDGRKEHLSLEENSRAIHNSKHHTATTSYTTLPVRPSPLPHAHAHFETGTPGTSTPIGIPISKPGHKRAASVTLALLKPGPLSRVSIPRPPEGGPNFNTTLTAPNSNADSGEAFRMNPLSRSVQREGLETATETTEGALSSRPSEAADGQEYPGLPSASSTGNGDLLLGPAGLYNSTRQPSEQPVDFFVADEWLAELISLVETYSSHVEAALNRILGLNDLMTAAYVPDEIRLVWRHLEEYVLCITEDALLRYMARLESSLPGLKYPDSVRNALCEPFVNLVMVVRKSKLKGGYTAELREGNDSQNEHYTTRIHWLKSSLNAVLDLEHANLRPSALLLDFIGGSVAALAMFVAIAFAYWGQVKLGLTTYDKTFVIMVIIAYILKDRIKVWGQRYYVFLVKKFGVMTPDHTIGLSDIMSHEVGTVEEESGQTTSSKVPDSILRLRHSSMPADTRLLLGKLTNEKVVTYKKRITLSWDKVERTVQEVSGVSDRTRIDLSTILQRAEDPTESHFLLGDRQTSFKQPPSTGVSTAVPRNPFSSGNGAHRYSSGAAPTYLSEGVTATKISCPRVYECVFVIKVTRNPRIEDVLKDQLNTGTSKVIRWFIGRGKKLQRAITNAPSLLALRPRNFSSSSLSGADSQSVEVTKVFRVVLDKNGVKRVVEVEGAREESVQNIAWHSMGSITDLQQLGSRDDD